MKTNWKILFWISVVLLTTSNLFWMYQVLDDAIGDGYYEDSCERYNADSTQFMDLLVGMERKKDVVEFLSKHKIDYETFDKGDQFIISLKSFQLIYDGSGRYIENSKF